MYGYRHRDYGCCWKRVTGHGVNSNGNRDNSIISFGRTLFLAILTCFNGTMERSDHMVLASSEHWRDEKINGIVYDMPPSPGYRYGIINSNIHTAIKQGLKNSVCLVTIENLDFKYHPETNDDYVCPDIMVVCDRKYLKGGSYSGIPKFVAETLSHSSAKKDRTEKKRHLRTGRRGRILDCFPARFRRNILSAGWEICAGTKLFASG